MKHLSKALFTCALLTLGANQANAALTHFVADSSLSQFSGNMSLDGTITATYLYGTDSSAVSGSGSFVGPVVGTVDANVNTLGGTFDFQGISLSSAVSGSMSSSTSLFGLPITADVSVTNATVDLAGPTSSAPLTYTGSGGIYSWGPTGMTLNMTTDYTATVSVLGIPYTVSSTSPFSLGLANATGTVTLDGSGNPIGYAMAVPGDLIIPLSLSTTSGYYTIDFTGNLTLNNLNLNLQGTSSVVPTPVPAALYLFGSGLLGLIAIVRRKSA